MFKLMPALILTVLLALLIQPPPAHAGPAIPADPLALAASLHGRVIAGASREEIEAAIDRYNTQQRKLAGIEQPFVDKTPVGFMEVEFDRMGREWVWLKLRTVTEAFLGREYPVGGAYSESTLVIPRTKGRVPQLFTGIASPLDPSNRFIVRSESGTLDLVNPDQPDPPLWSQDLRSLKDESIHDAELKTLPQGEVVYRFTQYEGLADNDPRGTEKGCEGGPALIHTVTLKLKCGTSACAETSRRVSKKVGCGPVAC